MHALPHGPAAAAAAPAAAGHRHLPPAAPPRCAAPLQEFSLRWLWDSLPLFLFYAFGVSFLGVALAIGIFRPRKQMPVDMFQVRGWVWCFPLIVFCAL